MSIIRGKIVKGFGEGAFYVAKYGLLFEKFLGFFPFAGTVNIKAARLPELKHPVLVEPGSPFKPVRCYRAKIRDMKCAVIVPEATRHPKDIVEIIAPVSIKEHFGLKDGDELEVEIE